MKLLILLILFLVVLSLLIYIFVFLQPSNNRNWEVGFEKLSQVSIQGNVVAINNVRDYHYQPGKIVSFNYVNRKIDASKINKVWFIQEPFTQFKAVAHTYLVFDIANEDPIALSVEARREKDQNYSVIQGMFNQYELMYIWGTETDLTIRRVIVDDNQVEMYPLAISNNVAQKLFLRLVQETHNLEQQPRFYNSLFSNCTNELAKAANLVQPNAIPFNVALFMPGYSANLLYQSGYIKNTASLDELTKKYEISGIVKKIYNKPDFSQQLRMYLNR